MSSSSLYAIHGIIQIVVFAGLYPLGAIIAVMRGIIGPSWKHWHGSIQLLASVMFLASATMITYALKRDKIDISKMGTKMRKHIWIGRMLLVVILLQIIWAYYGRRFVGWSLWYYVHMIFSAMILLGGWINIGLAKYSH